MAKKVVKAADEVVVQAVMPARLAVTALATNSNRKSVSAEMTSPKNASAMKSS